MFAITITALADGDFVFYETVDTAPAMEARVTELRQEYLPAHFCIDVQPVRRLVH